MLAVAEDFMATNNNEVNLIIELQTETHGPKNAKLTWNTPNKKSGVTMTLTMVSSNGQCFLK